MPTFVLSIPQRNIPFFKDAPLELENFFTDAYPDKNYPPAVHVLLSYYKEFEKNALDEGAKELIFDIMREDEVYTVSVSSDVSTGFNEHFKENLLVDFRRQLDEERLIPYSTVLQDKLVFPSQKSSSSLGGHGMGMSLTDSLLKKFQGQLFVQEKSKKVFFYLSASHMPYTFQEVKAKQGEVNREYQAVLRPSLVSDLSCAALDFSSWIPGDRKGSHPRSPGVASPSSPGKKRPHLSEFFQDAAAAASAECPTSSFEKK